MVKGGGTPEITSDVRARPCVVASSLAEPSLEIERTTKDMSAYRFATIHLIDLPLLVMLAKGTLIILPVVQELTRL